MTVSNLPVPEGMVATFEHHRRVILVAEAQPPTTQGPILMYSDPLWLRSWEWRKANQEGYGVYVLPEGGMTVCRLYKKATEKDEPDELLSFSEVRCSNDDAYVKATGRIKSLGAAISALSALPEAYDINRGGD